MSFVRRRIDVTFTLGEGDFGLAGQNTVTLTGLRVSANITKLGTPSFDQAQVRIWGLTSSLMNKLSTLGKPILQTRHNTITLSAGDANGVSTVFGGNINYAYQDFNAAPDSCINFTVFNGSESAMRPVTPTSFPGAADIPTVMTAIAQKLTPPCVLSNSGVAGVLSTPYYAGTALTQLQQAATEANAQYTIEDGVLYIWPKGGARIAPYPLISASSGLIGYPAWMEGAIQVRTLFLPDLAFGSQFQLQSAIETANGLWFIRGMNYMLESETPNGRWDIEIKGMKI